MSGTLNAAIIFFPITIVISAILVMLYDRSPWDLLGVRAVQKKIKEDHIEATGKSKYVAFLVGFMFFSIQFFPPITCICLRKNGDNRKRRVAIEWLLLISSSAVMIVYSAVVYEFGPKLLLFIYNFFKSLFFKLL